MQVAPSALSKIYFQPKPHVARGIDRTIGPAERSAAEEVAQRAELRCVEEIGCISRCLLPPCAGQVTVDESGKIGTVRVIHDVPSLTEEAKLTVQKWKFRPAKIEGKAVASTMVAAFYFGRPAVQVGAFDRLSLGGQPAVAPAR